MAGFRLATVSAVVSAVSFMAVPTITAAEAVPYHDQDSDASSLLQRVSHAVFRSIPKQKLVKMSASADQCAAHGVDCGPQVDEFESLLQMPKADSSTGVYKKRQEAVAGEGGASPLGQQSEAGWGSLNTALKQESAKRKHRRASTQEAIYAALEQNTHVSQALHAAVQQEETAAQEAANGQLHGGQLHGRGNHGFLRYALEENKRAEQALQAAVRVEEEEDTSLVATQEKRETTKGKRRRSTSQEAIYAALEQNAHLGHALESAVKQEEAAIQEAAKGHRVGAEHNGQTNHGFINYALQLDEKVNQALQSATQGMEEEQDTSMATTPEAVKGKRRKSTAQEAIYKAMEHIHQ